MPAATTPLLILASSSPQRRVLLAQAGYAFVVVPPQASAEDVQRFKETPEELVQRLARQKAADVAAQGTSGLILGCDTVAECAGEVLGKPADRADALRILRRLSGRPHRVLSGLCLRWPDGVERTGLAVTHLRMAELRDDALAAYLDSGGWQGKAGAFGYQEGPPWLTLVEGSESNVVGLPLELLARMLGEAR